MAFTKQLIKNRIAVGGQRYRMTLLGDGRYEIVPSPDSVTEDGTSLNAALFQRYEENIDDYVNIHKLAVNPHNITKSTVGLNNVKNVDQSNAVNITSGILPNDRLNNIPTAKVVGLNTAITNFENHIANLSNPHGVTKTQLGLGNIKDLDQSNADNITSGTLPNARLTDVPQSKIINLVADLSNKQSKSPTDNVTYVLQNGGIIPFNVPTGSYSEVLVTTLFNNETFSISSFNGYKQVRFECIPAELTGNPLNLLTIDSVQIDPKKIKMYTSIVNSWQNATSTEYSSGNSIYSESYSGNFVDYMTDNYPAKNYSIGDVAKGTILPSTVAYAKIVEITNTKGVVIKFSDTMCTLSVDTSTTVKFSTPSAATFSATYQLKIYGINY